MSSFTSKTVSYSSSSTKRKEAFSQELSAVLGKRGLVTSSEEVSVSTTHVSSEQCEESSDLSQILASKKTDSSVHYVYKVAERRCSLVVSAEFEAAVRDGDIKNVMLAKDSDTLLLKLRRGGDVAVDVSEMSIDGLELYDGEGPSEEVVNLRPKRKRGAGGTDLVRKIFEEKERAAEKAEETVTPKKPKVMKLDPSKLNGFKPNKVQPQVWNKFRIESRDIIRGCGADIFNNIIDKFDVEKVGKRPKKVKEEPLTKSMPTPVYIEPEVVSLSESIPGVIQQPVMVPNNVTGFEATICVAPLTPLIVEPEPVLQACIKTLDSSDLSKTAHVDEVFCKESPALDLLPRINEIPDLVNSISKGVLSVEEKDGKKVHGLKLDVNAAQRFIVGLSVATPNGSVFVPGQTVNTPSGEAFLAGMTVLTPEGPKLIPGQTVPVEDPSGETKMVFVAGQNLYTRDGEKFVQGQTVITTEGSKFMPGQTVITSEGPKFIPGQVVKGDYPENASFIPGQTVSTPNGPQFVPGQTCSEPTGETLFVPGQSIPTENGWDFVPGQTMVTTDGDVKFVPGQTVNTNNGPCFVPGQTTEGINNEPIFVPGVSVTTEDGVKFVPGATIDTPDGRKFVEGQVMKSDNGNINFVAGTTSTSDNGSFKFATAQSLDDVVFHDSMSLGLSMDSAAIHTTEKSDSIYGHMVQTSQGVEFFPGVASGLPAGKVVPGRLVRGKEVKFVPGIIMDDKFVPGQVVTTDRGEQFIPGQVVETKDGAKFVPGQIVETRQGPKFVPGQTVETEEGSKFVPGQIVQTKAGPTFIPGQVISTDNEGSRFVPGQVVDTIEGPRFVPGRVIETGDNVTFIPGQVVETSEGLRFIASDLQDNPEGEIEFTVQGFSVTPEELSLLKPHIGSNSIFAPASGEEAIDSRMMRQLSEAGMVIGRQVPAEVPVVDVRTVPAMGIACTLCTKLGLDAVSTIKVSQIMATVADLNCNVPIDQSAKKNKSEFKALKAMLKAASLSESEFGAYTAICSVLEKILCTKPDEMVSIVDGIHKFVLTSEELAPLRDSKLSTLHELMQGNIIGDGNVIEKLLTVLGDNEAVSLALTHLCEGNPGFIDSIIKKISETFNDATTNKDAADTLERAIIDAVRDSSELSVLELLNDTDGLGLKSLILQAVGLAKALGMRDVAATLLGVISDPNTVELLAGDRMTMDILRRLTVMRQLAEKRPNFKSALGQLQSDPDLARSNPLVRELVRVSGALMIVPEETPLIQNSKDIPTSLLQTDNSLAMEDFMLRSQRHGILLIIKHGLQAVVPRDASRAVLTGQVPYTVLDETGIHRFAPLHVFSALHLPPMYTHRFSMYSVQTDDDANTLTPGTSISDLRKTTASNPETNISEEGGEIIYTANQDYLSDDLDALTLHRGDQVIVLETGGGDPSKRLKLDPDLDLGVDVGSLLDNSAARHKIAVRPKRKHTDSRHRDTAQDERWLVQLYKDPMQQGWVPAFILTPHDDSPEETQIHDAKYRREAVIRELVETEEEFGRDVQQVVNFYMKPLDSKSVPAVVRDNKDLIFGNLKQIAEFHNTVLIEGVKYYANEPRMLGKTFLRLERDFDKHVAYCRDEPLAQDFLVDNLEARDFFEELSQQLGDDKSLSEHLKLPIQRINDYQLLLKELVKYSNRLGEDTTDLGKALELMLAVPHRANDNKFISNIEGYHGNIHKLGRLLRHDWFCVTDREGKSKERYLFLFKARILVCKVRRISDDRSVFVLKDIIRLPEVEVKDHKDDPRVFELHHKQPSYGSFPLVISAHKDKVKDAWLTEIRQYASDVLALAEHAADDLRLQETEENKNLEPLVGIHIEPATPDQTIPLEPRENQESVLKRTKKSPRTSPEPPKKPRPSPAPESTTDKNEDTSKPKKVPEEKEPPEPVKVQEPEKPITEKSKSIESITEPEKPKQIPIVEPPLEEEKPIETPKKVVEIKLEPEKRKEETKPVEEIQIEAQLSSKRKEQEEVSSTVDKKVKFDEEEEMDPYSSYSSRTSASRRVEEFRSVTSSSSQEVYVETSSSRHQMSSGISSSRNLRMVEESAMLDGRTISHMREITGGGDGYTTIQEITSGSEGLNDYAIEDVTYKTKGAGGYSAIKDSSSYDEERSEGYASKKESSSVTSSDKRTEYNRTISVKKPVFLKTIEGMNIEPGHKAVFECEVEDKAKVLWLKDNKPLEDKLADRISAVSHNDTKHRLQILGAHECDTGTYTARATNDEGGISSCTAQLLVETLSDEERKRRKEANAPYFLVRLNDTELLENTYLRFMVKVKGNPNPDVKFYKNDRLITVANDRIEIMKEKADKGFYELIIPDVQEEDAGTYKCIAMNKFGEVECEGTVSVTDDKNIFEGLEEADLLKPGESPNFTWFRDGKPFDPEERFKVLFQDEEDSLALVFQHVKPEDAGLYTCVASTSTGKIACSAELTVQGSVNQLSREPEKPKIVTEIKKQETTVGGSAMLELKVEGYPKPDIKWTKDGEELTAGTKYKMLYEDQESMSLVIKNIVSEDAGDYRIEAKNELGVDTEVIHLTVKSPPKIKRKLTDFSAMAGEDIKLTVEIEGTPKPDVTWYKDGKVIKKSDRVKAYDEESCSFTLVIEKSTLDDTGSYSVVATNELSQISEFCKVEVHSPPEFIKTMTKSVETNEGDTVTFQVKVQGDPQPTVKWFHNGSELKSDGKHIKISEDGLTHTLVVHGINRKDSGKYTCEIKNVHGSNTDNSDLYVRCSPMFRNKLVDTTAREGDTNIEFTVNVEAYPRPSIKWYHNEVEVTEKTTEFTRIEEGDNYKLIVKEVTRELSGKYSCIVTNDLGKNDCSATFTVKTKPRFTKGLKDTQVDEGASLTLQIEVEGTPDPVIKWFKDGEEVSGDAHIKITRDTQRVENYSMTFSLVKAADAGIYEVHATNEMGTAATISTVTVQTKTTSKKKEVFSMEEVPVEKPEKVKEEEPEPPQHAPEPEPPKPEAEPEPEPPKPEAEPEPEPPKPEAEPEPEPPKPEAVPEPEPPKPEPEPEPVKAEQEPEPVEEEPVVIEEVEPPKKVAEVEVEPPSKPLVQEEIIEKEPESPKKGIPEEVEPPKKATKEKKELPPKVEAEEVVTEPPKKAPVTEPKEEPQKAVEEGEDLKKVSIEDIDDEEKDLYNDDELLSQQVGTFSCVEVKADQIMYQDLPNSNSGLVEEFSESEDKGIHLSLSRNVSIVSVSEDERLTPLPEDASEPKFNIGRKKSVDSEKSKTGEVQDLNAPAKGRKLSAGLKEENESDKIKASKIENLDSSQSQKGSLIKEEEVDFWGDGEKTSAKKDSAEMVSIKGRRYSIETQEQVKVSRSKSIVEDLSEAKKGRRMSAEITDSNEFDTRKQSVIDNKTKSQKGALLEEEKVDFWGDADTPTTPGKQSDDKSRAQKGSLLEEDKVDFWGDADTPKTFGKQNGDISQAQKGSLLEEEKVDFWGDADTPKTLGKQSDDKSRAQKGSLLEEENVDFWGDADTPKSSRKQSDDKSRAQKGSLLEEEKIDFWGDGDTPKTAGKQSDDKSRAQKGSLLKEEEVDFWGNGDSKKPLRKQSDTEMVSIKGRRYSIETQNIVQIKRSQSVSEGNISQTLKGRKMSGVLYENVDIAKSLKVDVDDEPYGAKKSQIAELQEGSEDSVSSAKTADVSRRKSRLSVTSVELNEEGKTAVVEDQPNSKKGLKLDIGKAEDGKNETKGKTATPGTAETESSLKGKRSGDDDDDLGDSQVEALLKRVQKQRSVLEEILDKEGERADSEAAPEIISSDVKDINSYETLAIKYEIKAKGIPRPDAKWMKDGEEIQKSDHVKITEDGNKYTLEIKKLKLDDGGLYKCKLSNRLGEKVESGKLSIATEAAFREPKIKVPLKDMVVPKGEDAVFTLVLTADPVPETKWTHDGNDIDENFTLRCDTSEIGDGLKECSYTLTIPAGRHKDTGDYKFVAKNKFGTAECSARLDIVFRPEIICFKDTTSTPFEDIEMIANILANPRPTISWSAGGKVVKLDDRVYTENDTQKEVYKLLVKNVGTADENTYTVKATNNVGEATAQAKLLVHTEKPTILKKIENETLKDYTPFEFKIRANGVPKPKITWLKDGKPVVTSGNVIISTSDEGQVSSSLSFVHFSEADVGKYTVKAANLAGEAESTAVLKMSQIAPSFGKALDRSLDVSEGEPLELKAKVDGSPLPAVKWLKDGKPLESNDHVKLVSLPDGTTKLSIDSVKPTDCGAYKVLAINPNGESNSICAVAVTPSPRRPSFEKELEDVKVTEGEPLKLEAQVFAFPPPEMKWTKDGHLLRQSPGVSFINSPGGLVGLEIEKVKPEDAGVYALSLTNKLGDATSQAKVEVATKERKPQFLSQLMPVNVVEGFPAKLEIKVSGHPLPEIAWTLNGKPIIPDGQHIKIVDGPDGIQCLVIDKATPEDAGLYAVTAKNSQGEATSQAPLQVAAKGRTGVPEEPPSFPKGLRDTSTDEGTPLIFSTQFLGNPIPDVTWFKDGLPLESDERIQFTCDGNKVGLEINPSKLSDAGIYTCKLKNPLGEAETSAKAGVKKVFEKPHFTQPLTDVQQLPNLDAKLFARVSGFPKPDISWYKDGKPIYESDNYRMKRDGDAVCLYVQDCVPEDSGTYRCIASNKEGLATCDAQLSVVEKLERKIKAEPPAFLKKIGDCEVFKGMTAKFTACATGSPDPDVEWFRNGDKLYPSDRIKMEKEGTGLLRLTIVKVEPEADKGKYCCRIFNPHGEASCEAQLVYDTLDVRPKKPVGEQYTDYDKFHASGVPIPLADKPIISRMTDRRLTLSWKPSIPIGPRDPVTYQVEMCELPNGEWFLARSGVRSCACDISNLEPFRDYKFRIRVENKYGVSDPSPFAQTFRERLQPDPPKFVPYLPPGIDFRPETSPYFPKDFDIERPPHDGYAQAPKFLRQEHDTQYGVKNHNSNLFWFVYGYPKPIMTYYFNDEPIEMGGRYDSSYTRNGQATLFINRMLERDVGVYEAVARNEHGEARQRVRMEIAEYPEFIKRPEEMVIMMRRSGRIEARVIGVPYPEIKWYKDWQPLAPSSRIKIQHVEPDLCILTINDAIGKDEGLYSISARNVAGCVSSSAMVRIEESESEYGYMTYSKGRSIKPKTKPLGDFYDLGDELGRGTQGITYHAVERLNGRNYAAKVMHGKGDLKPFMRNEMEIMNALNHRKLIRLHDSFESPHTFTLITELAGGGELLNNLTKQTFTTESEIAGYIRQILLGLEYMHDQNIAHLGLTPGDLLISHAGGDDLKIGDFGLARRIMFNKIASLDYGMPEFVAPEVVNKEGVSFPADMWSLGVITHLLLTGISLFRGADDRTTLTNIKEKRWGFKEDIWQHFSSEARDFITRLLVYEQEGRMDVKAALRHPWLNFADKLPASQYNITTDTLRNYYNSLKDWYSNSSCRTWYRRRPLDGAFTHPSRMVYPPGDTYTPEPTPERRSKEPYSPKTWEDQIPSREPITYDVGLVKSESHYQNGPDTYLLQLRDVNFPVRLREYMKVAANRSPGYSREIAENNHLDWRAPVIRERRRFTDVMDEEIDDERRARINQYGSADTYTLRRLKHELGTRLDTHVEADALLASKRDGQAPFFREKPQILPIQEEHNTELVCFAVGDPKPTVQWFKNDLVITENSRLKIVEDEAGRSILKFQPALTMDVGIYKVVARNKAGQVVARTRIVLATVPSAPDSPEVSDISDTEILLRWKQPQEDGNSPVACYNLQFKEADQTDWQNIASNIDHEFYVVRDLKPGVTYQFRIAAMNKIGWSGKGIPTEPIKTKDSGAPKVQITKAMKHLQSLCESGQEVVVDEAKPILDYSTELFPIKWSTDQPTEKYNFISEIARGRFSVVVKGIDKSNDQVVVAKVLEWRPDTEAQVTREFDTLKTLRHERIAALTHAYRPANSTVAVLVQEKLQGADVLTYLSSRHEYTEQMVATVITQILDALQYLHWRGLCHLDLQPDNIVMASVRSVQVKLVDLGSAQRVTKLGTIVDQTGHPEYAAPEVLCDEPAFHQSDIWSVGVLAYVLLSGTSPFKGATPEETRQNINFVRYRFEHLYKELTQEATRFIMLVFKRTPTKRPVAEECHEHRWLQPTEYMIRRRERAVFLGNRLKEYSEAYHSEKSQEVTKCESLTNAVGGRGLTRSNSIQEELFTSF